MASAVMMLVTSALLTKQADAQPGKFNFDLQIPVGNTLITLHAADATEAEVIAHAQVLPVAKVTVLGQ